MSLSELPPHHPTSNGTSQVCAYIGSCSRDSHTDRNVILTCIEEHLTLVIEQLSKRACLQCLNFKAVSLAYKAIFC